MCCICKVLIPPWIAWALQSSDFFSGSISWCEPPPPCSDPLLVNQQGKWSSVPHLLITKHSPNNIITMLQNSNNLYKHEFHFSCRIRIHHSCNLRQQWNICTLSGMYRKIQEFSIAILDCWRVSYRTPHSNPNLQVLSYKELRFIKSSPQMQIEETTAIKIVEKTNTTFSTNKYFYSFVIILTSSFWNFK